MFLSLFLLGFSIAGQRNETEAANNIASTFMEHAHIIDHTFRLHKCACANIKVGVAAKLRREKFNFECVANERRFEDSNLFPSPNVYYVCVCHYMCVYIIIHVFTYIHNYMYVHVIICVYYLFIYLLNYTAGIINTNWNKKELGGFEERLAHC